MFHRATLESNQISDDLTVNYTNDRKDFAEQVDLSFQKLNLSSLGERLIVNITGGFSSSTLIELAIADGINVSGAFKFHKDENTVIFKAPRIEPELEGRGFATILIAQMLLSTQPNSAIIEEAGPKVKVFMNRLCSKKQFLSSSIEFETYYDGDDQRVNIKFDVNLEKAEEYLSSI